MKKSIVISFLLLVSFVCIGQTQSQIELVSLSKADEPFIQFEYQEGTFFYEAPNTSYSLQEQYQKMVTLCPSDILHDNNRVEINNNGYKISLIMTDNCQYIKQYVLYDPQNLIVDLYTFKIKMNTY